MAATFEDTYNFAKKFPNYKDFYTKHNDLIFSKLGLGTFNKEPYKEENYVFHYIAGVKEAVKNGINLIDTASNYRYGESEKEIAIALKELMEEENIKREELIICSKGGFIQLEYPFPENPYTWINENLIQSSLAKEEDIELDQHCMTPDYLEWSCKRSLKNLEIDTIDIYFLHNPEIQISKLGYKTWLKKVESAFKRFERMVKEDEIENKKAIEAKELISYGLIPEFVGRIPVIAELDKLSQEDLIRVLREPKNAITKQYEILFELDGVELSFSDDALERIAQIAYEKDVGARGLRGIIENIMLPLQYIIPSENNLKKCIITKDYIDKEKDVILEYKEDEEDYSNTKEIILKKKTAN